jgi:hypothetical protein
MKKLASLIVIAVFIAVPLTGAHAVGIPDNGPGCGLGKVAWEGTTSGDYIGPQLLISTTNNTILPWQAFGISSNTLGCKNNGRWFAEYKTTMFAEANFESLSQEMAQGQGEHLTSLATLMGVPQDEQPAFFAMTQERYTTLIQSGQTTPASMLKSIDEAMTAHPVLVRHSSNR